MVAAVSREWNRKEPRRLAPMVISTFKLPTSTCPKCGETGRFIGLEGVGNQRNAMVQTFECGRCGEYAIEKAVHKPPSHRHFRRTKPN
jgi:predicted RNA-binding Zn-ribbon protein involved in translation (DUF1610 family)